jgi:hypothetical protein
VSELVARINSALTVDQACRDVSAVLAASVSARSAESAAATAMLRPDTWLWYPMLALTVEYRLRAVLPSLVNAGCGWQVVRDCG